MPDSFHIDTSDLNKMVRNLERAATKTPHEVKRALERMGAEMVLVSKQIASDAGSKSIPPTIRMVPAPDGVMVLAGEGAPLAVLWEFGNKKSSSRTARNLPAQYRSAFRASARSSFRHPVFGHKDQPWVEQERHSFIAPARNRTRQSRTRELKVAWERVFESSGIHVETRIGGDS